MFNPKVFVAELIGTFALVFVGAAAGLYQESILSVALAHGLTLAVFIYMYGHISGTHVNPAVTLGLALNGTIKWVEGIVYWVAQFLGAVLAMFLLTRILLLIADANVFNRMATSGELTSNFPYYAMGFEVLLTFFLVSTVLHAAVDGKAGQFAGLVIGLTLVIAILAGGPLTGASLNPARSFGPAIFTSTVTAGTPDYQNPMFYLIYFVGPFIGSVLAVAVYRFFKDSFAVVEEMDDEDEIEIDEPVEDEPVRKPVRKSTTRKTTKE